MHLLYFSPDGGSGSRRAQIHNEGDDAGQMMFYETYRRLQKKYNQAQFANYRHEQELVELVSGDVGVCG